MTRTSGSARPEGPLSLAFSLASWCLLPTPAVLQANCRRRSDHSSPERPWTGDDGARSQPVNPCKCESPEGWRSKRKDPLHYGGRNLKDGRAYPVGYALAARCLVIARLVDGAALLAGRLGIYPLPNVSSGPRPLRSNFSPQSFRKLFFFRGGIPRPIWLSPVL